MKKKVFLIGLFFSICVLFTGCLSSKILITEFDKEGNIIKTTETTESPLKSFEESVKDKVVILWFDGLKMEGSISPGTTDNPMPHVKGEFKNGNGGGATIPKDMAPKAIDAVGKIINSTKSNANMGVSEDGVGINSK